MKLTSRRDKSGTTCFTRSMTPLLVSLVLMVPSAALLAQSDDTKPREPGPLEKYQTIYLSNAVQQGDMNDILTDLRNMIPRARIYGDSSQKAISIHGTADEIELAQKIVAEIELAQKIVADLDRSKKTYRLAFTITETDGGKRTSAQSFALVATSGEKTTFKQGSKVPIVTGMYDTGSSNSNSQVQYQDVGLSLEAAVDTFPDGLRLSSKVEQSAVSEEKSGVGPQDPVVRQNVLNGTSTLALGKPLVLGSIDVPGSTRRQEIEVLAEPVN
jgi:type II secretory pathway component GspD/PulD (secretin)